MCRHSKPWNSIGNFFFLWWEVEFITTSKRGCKPIRNNVMYHLNKTLEMAIFTGNVIKDKVKPVVKLKVFWIRKIIFKAVWWTYLCTWPRASFLEKSRFTIKHASIETNASINNIIAANIASATDNILTKLPKMETSITTVHVISHNVLQ